MEPSTLILRNLLFYGSVYFDTEESIFYGAIYFDLCIYLMHSEKTIENARHDDWESVDEPLGIHSEKHSIGC